MTSLPVSGIGIGGGIGKFWYRSKPIYCLSEISESELGVQAANHRQRERFNDKSKWVIVSYIL